MAPLPSTYKAIVVETKGGPLEIKTVDLQHAGPGRILVKVLACGVCFSDVAVAQGHMGDVFPRVPGHEVIGDVVEVGEGVTRFSVGDRVGAPWHGGKALVRDHRRHQPDTISQVTTAAVGPANAGSSRCAITRQ